MGAYEYAPPGELEHRADTDYDWVIEPFELSRVIGYYNAGAYCCYAATQDGYAPFFGSHDCTPHSSDYYGGVADWVIDAIELSRLVTFYNAGGYHLDVSTEDGFAPGPAPRK